MNKKTIKPVGKMKAGGSAGPCSAKGLCPEYSGSKKTGKCIPCSAGVYGGIAGSAAAIIGTGVKMVKDKLKNAKEITKIKKANPGMKRKDAREAYKKQNELPQEKRGGSVKSKKRK
jgi:hypothetical protein